MDLDALLDHIVVPRPNGSAALERTTAFLATVLRDQGADVVLDPFPATPHGLQIVWATVFLLVLGHGLALLGRRFGIALMFLGSAVALLLAEFELLWSPVSGLAGEEAVNVLATFAGRDGGPLLVFGAHYDTTTHFGDHLLWHRVARWLGPTTAIAAAVSVAGRWRQRRGPLPRPLLLATAAAVLTPYAIMAAFFSIGPAVRSPSPGALDNGGSVAALVQLAERLQSRSQQAPTTVTLAFFAAEEERALGSWHFATHLARRGDPRPVAVINLEGIGAGPRLTYVPEDGFGLRRWQSPPALAALVDHVVHDQVRVSLEPQPLPPDTLTDGRSFLAQGIPAITLRAYTPAGFPRHLHSHADERSRLHLPAITATVDVLEGLIRYVDAHPEALLDLPGTASRSAAEPG